MKRIVLYFAMIIVLSYAGISREFEFFPLNINFKGITVKNDTVIAYGEFGSFLISYDGGNIWNQYRIFDAGSIIKLFIEDDKYVAFNNLGDVGISTDKGINWNVQTYNPNSFIDTIQSLIEFPKGYFIRTKEKLLIISKNFEVRKVLPYISKTLGTSRPFKYKNSLTNFKNFLIAEIDSLREFRLDYDLNPIDTIDFKKMLSFKSISSYYSIITDSNYFYTNINNILYRTKDFIKVEKYYELEEKYYYFNFKMINNKIYFLEYPMFYDFDNKDFYCKLYQITGKNTAIKLSEQTTHFRTQNYRPQDFTVSNDKLIIIGKSKLITTTNFKDSLLNIVSDFTGCTLYTQPDKISDFSYLFYSGYDIYYGMIYRTNNNGVTFKPTVDKLKCPTYSKYNTLLYKYYDTNSKTLYIGGSKKYSNKGGTFISKDFGKSFIYKDMPDFKFNLVYASFYSPHLPRLPNLKKCGDNFVTATTISMNIFYNKIYTYSKDFDLIDIYLDSLMVIDYIIDCKDTNTFLIHCLNELEKTTEIKYTNNRGKFWKTIKSYPFSDSLLYYKEIELNNKKYFVMSYFNRSDSLIAFDALDIENRTIRRVYQYKVKNSQYRNLIHNSICSDRDTVWIAIEDTLFYTQNLFDRTQWQQYYIFPYHGRVMETFKKFGDKFFVHYANDYHTDRRYDDNLYWMIPIKEVLKPKPTIAVQDFNFGKIDIKNSDTSYHNIIIENKSTESELVITHYSKLNDSVFAVNLPKIDSLNPLIIKPNEFYEFEVSFKPKEVKQYRDSIIFYSNSVGNDNIAYLSGEGIDTTTDVSDNHIEKRNYLYSFPPYPIPAQDKVNALIYWDTGVDIDNDKIDIIDIFGNKIGDRKDITINKQTAYSGILTWNCSGVPNGIYFILINHGTEKRAVKVMVRK